jgi:hypothetical protein
MTFYHRFRSWRNAKNSATRYDPAVGKSGLELLNANSTLAWVTTSQSFFSHLCHFRGYIFKYSKQLSDDSNPFVYQSSNYIFKIQV